MAGKENGRAERVSLISDLAHVSARLQHKIVIQHRVCTAQVTRLVSTRFTDFFRCTAEPQGSLER